MFIIYTNYGNFGKVVLNEICSNIYEIEFKTAYNNKASDCTIDNRPWKSFKY